MHVDKDFELIKTQISQHLAWLSAFLKLYATPKYRNKGNFSK